MAAEDATTKREGPQSAAPSAPTVAPKKTPKKRRPTAKKKKTAKKRRKRAKKQSSAKGARKGKRGKDTAARPGQRRGPHDAARPGQRRGPHDAARPGQRRGPHDAAQPEAIETAPKGEVRQAAETGGAVGESVHVSSLRIFESLEPFQPEVATRAAPEPETKTRAEAVGTGPRDPSAEALSPEELSPEEALAMLAEISPQRATAGGRVRHARPRGSVVMPSCKVIAFESAAVASEMRVAGSTVARLYGMVREEELDLELGRICQTVDELVDEWDGTALGQTVILIVNLIGAERFLEEFLSEVPEVTEAFWIAYETLRGEVTSATNAFLAGQRAKRRAKAIGFGPRNVVAAARTGAEAVRWRVEWGFGGKFAARAS